MVSLLGLFQTIALMMGGGIVAVKKEFSREFVGFILSLASSMMLGPPQQGYTWQFDDPKTKKSGFYAALFLA